VTRTLLGRIVVISTHLDDGVFSLGGSIHRAAEGGARVTVATVLAGDPDSDAPAGPWDRASGFATAGIAARARREEDRRACAAVGATPAWLPFGDRQYGRGATDDEIWLRLEPLLEDAELVLVPGYPLGNEDHAWLAPFVLDRLGGRVPFAVFLEQPYMVLRPWARHPPQVAEGILSRLPEPPAWQVLSLRPVDRRAKRRACRAYRSQLRQLSRWRPAVWRVEMDERRRGGETVGWIGAAE
jgi:LmbE family N-acetylglucosaminyl deacetylase